MQGKHVAFRSPIEIPAKAGDDEREADKRYRNLGRDRN
jgi:hypothetical protein